MLPFQMATKPLTSEAIALTEKKMDMTLDDIIKMSKTNSSKSNKKQRPSNKNQRPFNGNRDKSLKIRQYMDSRSAVRQGVLAQRRTNFQGNSFPSAFEAARQAAMTQFRNRAANRNTAANWNKQRPGGSSRRQGNPSNGGNFLKRQPVQQPSLSTEVMPKQKPKTLDSLFANMREQRMRAFPHSNNGNGCVRRNGGGANQPRQPWLRGRFGNLRN
ncbi:hypothetical protein Cgig2_026939 [Carnegiea gigantea]|uniref:Uncharacterized protein n=1 Tax=Carnegiea gigantea TaxID=171969 RepID=A0A9Q1KWG5_9CARY|nr:hypothetical protein Cgig2_026939 [Carnegiea gigantea]